MSSNNYYCSTSASSVSCSCVSIRWVSSWVFSIGLICSYGSSEWTELTFGRGQSIIAWGWPVLLYVSLFLLNSFVHDPCLWFFWRCFYLDDFFFIYNGPLEGQFYIVPTYFINHYLTTLLLIPHLIQSSFRYGIDEVLGLWKDICWYCWLVFLCWSLWLVFLCWFCWLFFCVGDVDWCFCGCVDAELVHSDVGIYCQNSCLQCVQ